jgi:ABC-2 family transporter protein
MHVCANAGVHPVQYWLATYLWDAMLWCILTVIFIVALHSYGANAARVFVEYAESEAAIALLFLIYGFSVLPHNYCYTFLFNNHR